jgi:cell division septal protein FtsQ
MSFTANLAEADDDHELPAFDGPAGSEKEVLARFAELRGLFAPISLVPTSLSLSKRYAWTVRLDNGMSVELGRERDQGKDGMKARVQRLVSIYPQLVARLQEGRIDTIDMRYRTAWRCRRGAERAAGCHQAGQGGKEKSTYQNNKANLIKAGDSKHD